uniref:Uncharacterized protein n=1 Tax=Panagrolaimus sp. ES5 TaxID=591445 RepID=A0AC34GWV6_9BILA
MKDMESDTDSDSAYENDNHVILNSPNESGYNSAAATHSSESDSDDEVLITNHGGVGKAFADAKPTPTNQRKFGCQIFMFLLFIVAFAFMIFPCAIWIRSTEEKYEMYRIAKMRESSDEYSR